MSDYGIVYVATKKDRYVEEAFLSADSVRQRFPSFPITLFTDRPQHPVCGLGHFDRVEMTESVTGIASAWAEGQLHRLRCLKRTPYKRTLHLDTDTLLLTPELPSLFSILEEIDVGMVEASPDDSYSRRHYGRPMFNGCLILYRLNERTLAWLEEWARTSELNFRIADAEVLPPLPSLEHVTDDKIRRQLLNMDMISLIEILSPEINRFGLRVEKLDYSWIHRGSTRPENNRHSARIQHLPRQSASIHAEALRAATQRVSALKTQRSYSGNYTDSDLQRVLYRAVPAGGPLEVTKVVAQPCVPSKTLPPNTPSDEVGHLAGRHNHSTEHAISPDTAAQRWANYIQLFFNNVTNPRMTVYPGLRSRPWHDGYKFPIVGELEREYERIRHEIMAFDSDRYQKESENISRAGDWDVFFLYERGRKNSENCSRCPVTTRIIETNATVRTLAGLIYVSKMSPGTHIKAHRGPTNVRLRCHLGVSIPNGDCGLCVGGELRRWQEGKCIVFDDYFEHEAWNRADKPRIVLIVDLWHPDLTNHEVEFLQGLHRFASWQAENLAGYWRTNSSRREVIKNAHIDGSGPAQ